MPNNEARGLRKQSTLDSMKNDFATTLLDRTNELTRISDLRNQLNKSFKELDMLRNIYQLSAIL